jgi:hypothetical protein
MRNYLAEMSHVLDTLEALVPNVPPDEASYLAKEGAAAIDAGAGKRIFYVRIAHSTRHGICTTNLIRRVRYCRLTNG